MRKFRAFTLVELIIVIVVIVILMGIVLVMACSYYGGQREIMAVQEQQRKEPIILRCDVQVIEKVGSAVLEKHLTEMKGRRVVSVTPVYWYPCNTGRGIVAPYYIVISESASNVPPEKAN